MDSPSKTSTSLFEVYLRLRPSVSSVADRFLDVEAEEDFPRHITIKPPLTDHRKRAVERFAFTRVFEEDAAQLDLFEGVGALPLIQGVVGADGREGRDGLLATLGVTGSGKSHTILGSKSQRGLTQMMLDVLFQSIADNIVSYSSAAFAYDSLARSDVSEAHMLPASTFLDQLYGDSHSMRGSCSRAQTPMPETSFMSVATSKQKIPRPSCLPQAPDMTGFEVPIDSRSEYAVVISMYEVYNDRIYDLLAGTTPSMKHNAQRRRPLLFKSTELSPDRKVVAGLKKIVCFSLEEAVMVLETGLTERRVAGTGSNAVSSRSHGFFCLEIKKRDRVTKDSWKSGALTVVDLAGSERARQAKTAGATLAEAGKINESLMYLGQCMQMQSDNQDSNKSNIVPFRQCKLTELLFSNSYPSSSAASFNHHHAHRQPQKAIMIVTADPLGDFNATSQILRYSALAREVTVPRIPSTTSTILAGPTSTRVEYPDLTGSANAAELEAAQREIQRLTEEVDVLTLMLAEEKTRREEVEDSWRASEERLVSMEQDIRDECFEEMDARLEAERRRWKSAWDEEADKNDERMDRKLEILAKGIRIYEDPDPGLEGRVCELESENEALRRKIDMLEREAQLKSPSKKQRILKAKKWEAEAGLKSP